MYYVYIYRDPRDGKNRQPIYIGKGTGNRAWAHTSDWASNKFFRHFLRHLDRHGLKPIVEIYRKFASEEAALACERRQIAKFGRRCLGTGTLLNIDEGGTQVPACAKELWQDPEYREKVSAGLRRAFGTPEARAYNSAKFKALWKDPAYRAKQVANIIEFNNRPDVKQKRSRSVKVRWQDNTYREAVRSKVDAFLRSDAHRVQKAEETRAFWADPEHREMRLSAHKEALAQPEERARRSKASRIAMSTVEAKARSGATLRAIWDDPARRMKQLAAQSWGKALRTPEQIEVQKQKSSASRKALWADPEWRANTTQKIKETAKAGRNLGALPSPEVRSAAVKRGWSTISAEQRTQRALRIWATRRARAQQQLEARCG